MAIKLQNVLSQNITLQYDTLDLSPANIDRNELRNLAGKNAAVMDTDEMVVALQPANATIIQLGDRRIRATIQQPSKEIGGVAIWLVAQQLHQLVKNNKLLAYGFNFDAEFETTAESRILLQNHFIADREQLEARLGGQFESIIPRLHFKREGTRYDLILEAQDNQRLTAHLNAHFERERLPPQNVLEREYRAEYREFVKMVAQLTE